MSTIDTSTWNPDPALNESIGDIPLNESASINQTWQAIQMLMAAGGLHGLQLVTFEGATASADGTQGLVPAPEAGDQDKFLKGDGAWADGFGKSSVYCADCNAALTPGRYCIDSNTAHSPNGKAGILEVESKGGSGDPVWQTAKTEPLVAGAAPVKYARLVEVSSGAFSSATSWAISNFVASGNTGDLLRISDPATGQLVLCPPVGIKLPGQSTNFDEFLRLYHNRDVSRDSSLNTYGFIARICTATSPTSGSNVNNTLNIGSVEGGIASDMFQFQWYPKCASVVTYTDATTETVYGKFLKAGDIYNNKTVASASYTRNTSDASFVFTVDNKATLGKSSQRFSTVYAGTGSINTSDERLKSGIESIPDAVLDAWGEVGWVQFQFNDAVAEKGDDARLHSGLIAQRINAVFKAHGLDAARYGLFCHDVWEADEMQAAGDRYSLRYEEAVAMEAAYQRRRADRLEARIKALEEKLNG